MRRRPPTWLSASSADSGNLPNKTEEQHRAGCALLTGGTRSRTPNEAVLRPRTPDLTGI
ncbi:uncharacterized protein FOMMEDRAFT_159576 [Fomitiporia mediterranea MF3/22]|uniref:uncharacterized protein n=1 Tax=Fomitiporia mediterranea (strain MF3/22) TaxID=694068 RepID=UPI0004408BBA|nr:uncharacterized protein FOMMEDRAFT_159576 [Fomitiporia mediterranea MF3/22]EJC99996.1 hypothetical protein FOMMEDRAFT_159576 [Fomitiporia mediterranea MF3/22]